APGPTLGGVRTRVGEVVQVAGAAGNVYLVTAGGLAPIDPLPAMLVLAAPANAAAYPGGTPAIVPVPANGVSAVKRLAKAYTQFPARPPAVAGAAAPGSAVCVA